MKSIYCLVVFCVLILTATVSCTPSIDSRLRDVEAGMDTDPDSVVMLLEGIAPSTLIDDRSRAIHTLLLSRARHKAHMVETNDSMIGEAANFFKANGARHELMMALYYKGVINNNARNGELAMRYAEGAKKIATDKEDIYWMAKTHELIADVFHTTYNYPEEILARRIAATYYNKADRRLNYLYSLLDLSIAYANKEEYENSVSLLDSIMPMVKASADSVLTSLCYNNYFTNFVKLHKDSRALEMADSMVAYGNSAYFTTHDYLNFATLKDRNGDNEGMLPLLYKARSLAHVPGDSVGIYLLLVNYYERMGDLRMALAMEDSILAVNNRQVMYAIEQSGVAVQREVMRAEARERELEARWRGTLAWIVGGAGVVTLVCVVIIFGERMRRKEMELRARMGELQQLSAEFLAAREEHTRREEEFMAEREAHSKREEALESELTERQMKNQIIMARVGKMFGEQWRMINNICASVLRKRGTKVSHTIYADLEKEFERLRSPEGVNRIAECVDTVKDGVARRLSEQAGKEIGEDGYMLAVYLLAGFSIQGASAIMGVNEKTLYGRRSRLLKRITELRHSPDKEEFLNELRPLKGERDQ